MARSHTFSAVSFTCIALLSGGASATLESNHTDLVMGFQAIYGPNWRNYSFTNADALTEQVALASDTMGNNQIKLTLAFDKTCPGYLLGPDCDRASSLKELTQVPAVAAALAKPNVRWYQLWLYSYSNHDSFLKRNWTNATLQAEYDEVYDWALHVMAEYANTGKVFMAGNWEGDWMLLGASGCGKPGGGYNKSCDPTPEVIERMVQWAQVRQRAIEDARAAHKAAGGSGGPDDVSVLYYVEMNLGPEAVGGKPGVTNDVVGRVNPDLVSYSSYSSTNAYATTTNVTAVDLVFHSVLDYVSSKLPPPRNPSLLQGLGLSRRVFVGEYGAPSKTKAGPITDFEVVRFVSRVMSAAARWGVPWVLYWELYSNDSTFPIVPRNESFIKTGLYQLMVRYYERARAYAETYANDHEGKRPDTETMTAWVAEYFTTPKRGSCEFVPGRRFPGPGYSYPADSEQTCCDICATDPTCAVAEFDGSKCYVKYSTTDPVPGNGTACVKQKQQQQQ